jgi:hypothetical protein
MSEFWLVRFPPDRATAGRALGGRGADDCFGARVFSPRAPRAAPTMGGGARTGERGERVESGIGGGWGPLRCNREGHVVSGVCNRGRWLLRAQVAYPGRVHALPRPAHAPEGDRLGT